MANLMGFKKVSRRPLPCGTSIYDELLTEVSKTGGIYVNDTQDRKRANSLAVTLRGVIKKHSYDRLVVSVIGTNVCIEKKTQKDEEE